MTITAHRHCDGVKECMDHGNDDGIMGGVTARAESAWLLEEVLV